LSNKVEKIDGNVFNDADGRFPLAKSSRSASILVEWSINRLSKSFSLMVGAPIDAAGTSGTSRVMTGLGDDT
jgi:hypothetical protein